MRRAPSWPGARIAMARLSTDLPRMQNQARARAALERDLHAVGQGAEKPVKSNRRQRPQMMRQYDLIERVRRYNPNTSEALLNRAYVYAMKAHGEQKRASGDPYFSHPLEVAAILTDLKLDDATIAAALLHDTIEDTEATRDEIDQMFGRDIGALVEGLTKLKKLDLVSKEAKQAENLRKLLLAIADDVRVLLIKLADRLHNMRTLEYQPPSSRRRTADETLEIYAPLAGRMGMQEMREELEDLAFRELNPDAYKVLTERLETLAARSSSSWPESSPTAVSPPKSAAGASAPIRSGARWSAKPSALNSCPTFSVSGSSLAISASAIRRWALCTPAGRWSQGDSRTTSRRRSKTITDRSTPL